MLQVQLSLPRAKSARRLTWYFALSWNLGHPPYARQEVIDSENLLSTGDDFADAAECGRTEPFGQRYAIFDLSRDHVAIEVATSFISSRAEVLLVGDTALVDAPVDDE